LYLLLIFIMIFGTRTKFKVSSRGLEKHGLQEHNVIPLQVQWQVKEGQQWRDKKSRITFSMFRKCWRYMST
jgi:hypothetical protein